MAFNPRTCGADVVTLPAVHEISRNRRWQAVLSHNGLCLGRSIVTILTAVLY